MRLTELQPQFVRYETRIETVDVVDGDPETWRERGAPTKQVTGPREHSVFVESIAEAQGIWFLCPKCYSEHAGKLTAEQIADPEAAGVGVHMCSVSFEGRGVEPSQGVHNGQGQPVRWTVSGTGFEDLTTTPSILIEGGCGWHGFITNGAIS